MSLRELTEQDLGTSLEGDFGLPVELTDPEGVKYTTKKGSTELLMGQVLFDTVTVNPETVEPMTVNNPVVTLRRSSLVRIPAAGELWTVRIPTSPSLTAEKGDYVFDPDKAPGGGASIGYIKLYLHKVCQS